MKFPLPNHVQAHAMLHPTPCASALNTIPTPCASVCNAPPHTMCVSILRSTPSVRNAPPHRVSELEQASAVSINRSLAYEPQHLRLLQYCVDAGALWEVHTNAHTCARTHARAHARTHTHTQHTHTHATHTHTHTHNTHTRTHAHTLHINSQPWYLAC